jgi:hypothetical protein
VFTRVLEFRQYHTPPAKQIDASPLLPASPPYLLFLHSARGFGACARHDAASRRIGEIFSARRSPRSPRTADATAAAACSARMRVREGPTGSQLRFRSHESATYPAEGRRGRREAAGAKGAAGFGCTGGGGRGGEGSRGLPSPVSARTHARTQRRPIMCDRRRNHCARIYLYVGSGRMRERDARAACAISKLHRLFGGERSFYIHYPPGGRPGRAKRPYKCTNGP